MCNDERDRVAALFVDDGGARLKRLLARLHARGARTFRFPKVHRAEISKQSLETLGFRADGHVCPLRGDGATRLASVRRKNMKSYHDIAGDGGSRVLEQVVEQRTRITDGLAGVRHLVAVGSGKGGVGKSTLTLHLAGALRARGLRIAILDADFNGPSQARMAGVQGALFVPGSQKVALPRTTNGIAVFSMGSLIAESEALEFESAAHGESHTWRATREFSLLGEILRSFEWGALDLLMFDLPPGAERTVQYADYLGPRTSFVLVTIPSEVSRGVVARSVAALSKGPNRLLGYVENMSGYYCRDCNAIKPLFASPDQPVRQTWGFPVSGPSPSIPSSRVTAIEGFRSRSCPARLSAVPWITSRSSFWTTSNRILRSNADEVPLRSLR